MNDEDIGRIQSLLQAVRRRIRRIQLWRGALWFFSVFLGGLVISMAIDWLFSPPALVRWIVFAVWLGGSVWSFFKGFAPFFQKLSLLRIARWLESRHPEMEERLSTALELTGQESGSPELLLELVQAAEEDALLVDADIEVKPGLRTRQWSVGVGLALIALVVVCLVAPTTAGRLVVRSLAPFSQLGNAGAQAFKIKPGDLDVMSGGVVEIELLFEGHGTPEIVLDFESGTEVAQPFAKEGNHWRYRLEPVEESFRYRARVGRALSDQFTATVWPQPEFSQARAEKTFPKYLSLPNAQEPLGPALEAVVGTKVRLSGQLNTVVESAELRLPDGQNISATLEPSALGVFLTCDFEFTKGLDGEALLVSQHRLGGDGELVSFKALAVLDRAPEVALTKPQESEIKVRPQETLELSYEVKEDFALGEVVLEVEAGGKGSLQLSQALPSEVGRLQPKRFLGTTRVLVAELVEQLKGAQELHLRFRADDKRPPSLDGPGRGYSEWLIVRVSRNADSLAKKDLNAQQEEARSGIEKAIRTAREAEQKMRQSWHSLVDERKEDERAQKVVQEAQEKLAQVREEISALSQEMEQGIHAAKTPQLEEANEKVAEATDAFEKVPLQDSREERAQGMEEALQHSREAIHELEELRNEINQDRAKVNDLVRLEELAQEQKELARKAEKRVLDPASENENKKWQQEQKSMANKMKSQLHQRPEAMAEALAQLAEQARDLVEESEAVAETQRELAEMSKALGSDNRKDEKEQFRMDLKAAQLEVAQQAAESVDSEDSGQSQESRQQTKHASQKGRQAAQSMSQGRDEQAAKASLEAAERLLAAAESSSEARKEESAALAQRQQEIAAAAQSLAEGDLAKAQEQLNGPLEDEGSSPKNSEQENALAEKLAEQLAAEQGAIAHEARAQAADAGKEAGESMELADLASALLSAAGDAQEAKEAFERNDLQAAAGETAQAAAALSEMAQSAEDGESSLDAAAAKEKVADLAQRQNQVAQAAEALAKGEFSQALEAMQGLSAQEAAQLSEEIQAIPQLQGSPLSQASQQSRRGEQQATQAAKSEGERAGQQHQDAARSFAEAADSLAKAADQIAEQAQAAAQKESPNHQAPTSAEKMNESFQAASQAAQNPSPAQAAQQAREAAEALAEAAQQSRQQMQGLPQPQDPGEPSQLSQPTIASGEEPPAESDFQQAEADQGLPPELAKLGMSVEDWAKIKASLRKDVGERGGIDVPEDYQGLVKDYFQTMSEQ